MPLSVILLLVWIHFVADFLLQTEWMANNKSHNNRALGAHCAVYLLCLFPMGILYAIINALAHFCVDYLTSRMTSRLYREKRWRAFFKVIGLDQAIHMTTLIVTYALM